MKKILFLLLILLSFFASCKEEYTDYIYSFDRNTQVLDIELTNRMPDILEFPNKFPNLTIDSLNNDILLKGNVSFVRNNYKDEFITYFFVNFRITKGEYNHSDWIGRVDVKVEKTSSKEIFECSLEY